MTASPRPKTGAGPLPQLGDGLETLAELILLLTEPAFLLREDGRILGANAAADRMAPGFGNETAGLSFMELCGCSARTAQRFLRTAFGSRSMSPVHVPREGGDRHDALHFEAGRLRVRDTDGTPLAFVRVRKQQELLERCLELSDRLNQAQRRGRAIRDHAKELEEESAQLRSEMVKLERTAKTDPLTGLPNRSAFEQHLARLWAASLRNHEPLALAIVDIDDFKQVNDTWGHPKGDDCLQAVARALGSMARRPFDLVARLGGEEFAIVLHDCSYRSSLDRAAVARRVVEAVGIPHPTSASGHLTVSVGVASLVPDRRSNQRALYTRADRALYEAKSRGKNRVCAARSQVT